MMENLKLALWKVWVLLGGKVFALILSLLLIICFAVSFKAEERGKSSKPRIAVTDLDRTELSAELVQSIAEEKAFEYELCTEEEAREKLAFGQIELRIIIGKGYGDALTSEDSLPIELFASDMSDTLEMAREIVGGIIIEKAAYEGLYSGIGEERKEKLDAILENIFVNEPVVYSYFENENGVEEAKYSYYYGFTTFVILLMMLCFSGGMMGEEYRKVEKRMRSQFNGRRTAFISDVLALYIFGLTILLLSCIFYADKVSLMHLAIFVFLNSGLCLLLKETSRLERTNIVSVLFAVITSLIGGCFIDIGKYGRIFSIISLLTPQGLCLRGIESGNSIYLLIMAVLGIVLLFFAMIINKEREETLNG